jgi:endonuclease/exonuclease/phosphatase family metal-dependent hydrolase
MTCLVRAARAPGAARHGANLRGPGGAYHASFDAHSPDFDIPARAMHERFLRGRLRHLIRLSAALLFLPQVALAEAPSCQGGAAAAPERVEIATYNVQFATPDVPLLRHVLREIPGHKPNVPERALEIAARLACFDIIGLQETISDARRAEIVAELERVGRACGKPSRLPSGRLFAVIDGPDIPDGAGWLPLLDDELTLASRWPIVATGMHVFADAAGADALAAKGVLHARLARGPGPDDLLEVFVTHLQANAEQAEVRRRQIAQLAAFVQGAAHGGAPVLVMGDLNLWGGDPDRADPGSEYNLLLEALNEAVAPRRFVDLWLEMHPDDPEAGSGTKPRVLEDGSLRPREKRVDFILLASDGRAVPRAMRHDFFPSDLLVDDAPVGHLSNHAAVLAEVDWRGAPPSCAQLSESPAQR